MRVCVRVCVCVCTCDSILECLLLQCNFKYDSNLSFELHVDALLLYNVM